MEREMRRPHGKSAPVKNIKHIIGSNAVKSGEEYPEIRGKPQVRNIRTIEGNDWFQAKVKATGNRQGEGFNKTRDGAVKEAYHKAVAQPIKK